MKNVISIWLNGLSGAGKTTLAVALKERLTNEGLKIKILDGDLLRKGINKDLGFDEKWRTENLRRAAEINLLFLNEGYIVINAFIAPTVKIRTLVREVIGEKRLLEISLNTPLSVCMDRDVKGLYSLVKKGVIKNMTGVHQPFEPSETADLTVDTSLKSIEECVDGIIAEFDLIP